MQFVSSYSLEKVAVLGRIILLLPPGLHSWHARPTTVWLLWAAWVYNVIHLSPTCLHWCPTCLLLTCMSHDVPDVPQQHPPLGFLPDFLPSLLPSFPQRWNSIQINNSQSNKEKNYQNLNETLRARRCDTTSGHLEWRKPSGSSSVAIQQQLGSSQRQQLSNSQQLSSSLTVVAKYSWTYRSHW